MPSTYGKSIRPLAKEANESYNYAYETFKKAYRIYDTRRNDNNRGHDRSDQILSEVVSDEARPFKVEKAESNSFNDAE
jgi:hypothetical protein